MYLNIFITDLLMKNEIVHINNLQLQKKKKKKKKNTKKKKKKKKPKKNNIIRYNNE
jgi:hypothetical protein